MAAERTILQLMDRVLGETFAAPSWPAWRALLAAIFALPLSEADQQTFCALTGRSVAPTQPASEVWAICGRRSGKSAIAALVAVFLTTCRTYQLAPGEKGVFMVLAADRRQARVVRNYIGGLLHTSPVLEQLVAHETKESIELTNGLIIEIHTASYRAVRGYTVVGAICDEIAFWPTDESSNPDSEILAALRPAMATVPGALLLCLSSPYARKGELWRAHRDHYGRDDDPVLVLQAPTRALNPNVPESFIEAAYAADAASARAEYGAQFRSDIETFISIEVLNALVVPGRHELAPVSGASYVAFVDPSGGSGTDSFTLAIAHAERRRDHAVAVLDCAREIRPPFSPSEAVREFAGVLRAYHVRKIHGDRFAGEWPREQFRRYGIDYLVADRPKSDYYRDCLPLLNSGRVELLDHPRLLSQLGALERRTARGGRDSIDHPPAQHDDIANVAAAVAVLATTAPKSAAVTWGRGADAGPQPHPEAILLRVGPGKYRWTCREGDAELERLLSGGEPKPMDALNQSFLDRFCRR